MDTKWYAKACIMGVVMVVIVWSCVVYFVH